MIAARPGLCMAGLMLLGVALLLPVVKGAGSRKPLPEAGLDVGKSQRLVVEGATSRGVVRVGELIRF
jgi:hypothetical protein